MKLKCITNNGYSYITVGKEYNDFREYDSFNYKIRSDNGRYFNYSKKLFEVIGEEIKIGDTVICLVSYFINMIKYNEYKVLDINEECILIKGIHNITIWYPKEYFKLKQTKGYMEEKYELTKEKILAMANKCPTAKDVLKEAFPRAFEEDKTVNILKINGEYYDSVGDYLLGLNSISTYFHLNTAKFNWELKDNKLIPTKK